MLWPTAEQRSWLPRTICAKASTTRRARAPGPTKFQELIIDSCSAPVANRRRNIDPSAGMQREWFLVGSEETTRSTPGKILTQRERTDLYTDTLLLYLASRAVVCLVSLSVPLKNQDVPIHLGRRPRFAVLRLPVSLRVPASPRLARRPCQSKITISFAGT